MPHTICVDDVLLARAIIGLQNEENFCESARHFAAYIDSIYFFLDFVESLDVNTIRADQIVELETLLLSKAESVRSYLSK